MRLRRAARRGRCEGRVDETSACLEMAPETPSRPSEGTEDVFALRLVTIDYYLAKPTPGLDATVSAFLGGAAVDKVSESERPGECGHPPRDAVFL